MKVLKFTNPSLLKTNERVKFFRNSTNFFSQKLKRRIFATVGFNSAALCATAVVWPPRNCDLTPLDYYLWDAVKDKINEALFVADFVPEA